MQADVLIGTWRTTKIHWHGDYITHYTDNCQWRQLVFEPGGVLNEFENYKGQLNRFPTILNWQLEKGEIIMTENNRWIWRVLALTSNELIIKADTTQITYYCKKI